MSSVHLATRVVPCRSAPVGSSRAYWSRGGHHTSSPGSDFAESRLGSRLSHPFQEEMMRMTLGWTGLRTAVVALGLCACAQTGVNAAAISATSSDAVLGYSTAGSVDTTKAGDGVSGTNVISFV